MLLYKRRIKQKERDSPNENKHKEKNEKKYIKSETSEEKENFDDESESI